jgi:hypothetical protein
MAPRVGRGRKTANMHLDRSAMCPRSACRSSGPCLCLARLMCSRLTGLCSSGEKAVVPASLVLSRQHNLCSRPCDRVKDLIFL